MAQDLELFAGTASFYARYRPPYPSELFERLVAKFGLGAGTAVLDLGCGTGQLALPLSRTGSTVWAMDPDPDMLAEAIRTQAHGQYGPVRWILGRGEDVRSANLPSVRLCTMGASFHWMDRPLVLMMLDELIEPGGGVALASGSASVFSQTGTVESAWLEVAREVIVEFLGPQRRAGRGTYNHPKLTHEQVLAESAFSNLETQRITSRRVLSVEDIVGLQLSTSYASPAQLGDRLTAFRAELTRKLLALNPEGMFETVEHIELILAVR